MTLTRKTFLLLLAVTFVSFGAAITEQQLITVPAFKALEARSDRKDVERLLTGFDAIRSNIHTMTFNHALRDDTYAYFHNRDPGYLKANYVIDTFIGGSIDLVVFADRDGSIFWFKLADFENETFYPQDYYNPDELQAQLPNVRKAYPGAPVSRSGIVDTRLGPMIFSAYSVHNSDSSGASPGSVLIARLINPETLREVRQLVKVPFTTSRLSPEEATFFNRQQLQDQHRNPDNTFDWYLRDINNNPILRLTLDQGISAVDQYKINNPAVIAFILTTCSWFIVIAYLNWTMVRPILSIRNHLNRIRITGNYYPRLCSTKTDEIGDLSNECDALIEQIEKQNRLLSRQSAELRKLSLEDALTGLSNRRHLDQLLADYWSIHQREQQPLSFILCDIDYFKRYNDNYGHQAGDEALKQVAMGVRSALPRKSDKAARYGGEEFAVLLPDTDPLGAVAVAKRIQQKIAELAVPHGFSKVDLVITMSIGCATITPDAITDSKELFLQADKALYRAKALGRNQIAIYNPAVD